MARVAILAWLAVLAGLSGCLDDGVSVCASGRVCGPGTVCDDDLDRCVGEDQRDACDDLDEGDDCSYGSVTGRCRNGFCDPFVCGDGERTDPEACDRDDLDGMDCTDFDFYLADGLACDMASCTFDLSGCQQRCGDGMVNGDEDCDLAPPPELSCLDVGDDFGRIGCHNATCTPATEDCRRFGWSPVPIDTTEHLHSVWGAPSGEIFALGENATHVFDGADWTVMSDGPVACPIDRSEIWGRAADDVFVATCDGLYHYDGSEWTHVVTDVRLHGIGPVGEQDVYAVGADGTVLRNSGGGWTSVPSGPFQPLWDVTGTGPNDVWVVESFEVRHYDGDGWSRVTPPSTVNGGYYWGVELAGDDLLVAVPSIFAGGAVFRYDGTWDRFDIGAVLGVAATAGDRAVAVTQNGEVFHYDGDGWERARDGGGIALSQVFLSPAGTSYAVGERGLVLRHDGAWLVAHEPPLWRIEDMWAVPGSPVLYAAGCEIDLDAGTAWPTVFRHDGQDWSIDDQILSTMGCHHGIWGSSASDIHVVAADLAGSRQWNGAGWQERFASVYGVDIWGWGPGDAIAVGFQPGVWNGASWTPVDIGTTEAHAVWGPSPDDVYAVGDGGVIVHKDASGWSPMVSPTDEDFRFVWGPPGGTPYAGTTGGTLLRYDGASGWQVELEMPGVPLMAAAGTGPEDVWVAAGDGTLLHYDGVAWSPVRAGTTSDLLAIVAGSRRLVTAGDFGAITEIRRDRFWHCQSDELCADGIDNDCDLAIDGDDDGC